MEWGVFGSWLGSNFAALVQAIAAFIVAVATVRYVRLTHDLVRAQHQQLNADQLERNARLLPALDAAIKQVQAARERLAAPTGQGGAYARALITPDLEAAIPFAKANPHPWVRRKIRNCEGMLRRAESLLQEIDRVAQGGLGQERSLADLGEKISSCVGLLREVEEDFTNMRGVLVGEIQR